MTTVVKPLTACILEFQHDSVFKCSNSNSVSLTWPDLALTLFVQHTKQQGFFPPKLLLIGELSTRNSVGQGKRKEAKVKSY